MAQFRKIKGKRGTRYQAVVRKRGHELSRTFDRSDDCKRWANAVEHAIDTSTDAKPFSKEAWLLASWEDTKGKVAAIVMADASPTPTVYWTLSRAFDHYAATVTAKKKGEAQELTRMAAIQKRAIAEKPLCKITPQDLEDYKETRKEAGAKSITIAKDLWLISSLFRIAGLRGMDVRWEVRGWGLDIENPCNHVAKAKPAPGRKRRLRDGMDEGEQGEEERIIQALLASSEEHGQEMVDFVMLAVATGMRRGELAQVQRWNIVSEGGNWLMGLPDSKGGHPRRVVLNKYAQEIIRRRIKGLQPGDRLFNLTENQRTHLWRKARKKAGCTDLRMHDLRHEALSRMALKGLHLGMLMNQSGHRDPKSLQVYLNALTEEIAARLDV